MSKELEIADCIRRMAGIPGNPFVVCRASKVDDSKMTCDGKPEDGTAMITGIRLVSITGNHESTVVIPEDDSLILVAMLSKTDGYVMHCSKAKKIMRKVGNSAEEITTDLIKWNDGQNEGLVIIGKLTAKLNNLITEVNALKTDYTAHTHPTAATGPPSVPTVPYTGTFSNFNKSDYENTKIKH